ncbi:hypothetical protein Y699_02143 [Aspergillus fumigatus Z5]|nr:hypothetical protein Y699_02143 [Aspergillus fumigatus Z5]
MSLEVLQPIFDFRLDVNNKVLLETGVVGSIVFQPFPRSIAQKALELGDLLDLPQTRTLFSFISPCRGFWGCPTLGYVYCPLYMNDIDAGQE